MSKTVLHKRSVVVENGLPKLPTSAQTEYGEIAINYAKGYETLSIRNNQDEIVTFSSDDQIKKILDESELVIASALNDLNTRVEEISANTSGITEYSAGTNIDITDHVISVTGFTAPITSITLNGSAVTISGGVADLGNLMDEDDDRVIAEALIDLNNQISGLSADTIASLSGKQDTLISGVNIKTVNGQSILGSGDISITSETGVVSSIIINGNYVVFTGGTVNLGDYITQDKEYVISSSLNDLNDRILALSASTTGGGGTVYTAGSGISISNNVISVTGKQETLVSGTNIKTINSQSILGSGNITIQGGGGGTEYSAGTNIDITDYVISVTGLSSYETTSNKVTTISSGSTDTQYPSAKCVYDIVGNIDSALNIILTGTTS